MGLQFELPTPPQKRVLTGGIREKTNRASSRMYRKSNQKAKTLVAIRFLFAIMRAWPSLEDKKRFIDFLERL
jgi:hypothetical protein